MGAWDKRYSGYGKIAAKPVRVCRMAQVLSARYKLCPHSFWQSAMCTLRAFVLTHARMFRSRDRFNIRCHVLQVIIQKQWESTQKSIGRSRYDLYFECRSQVFVRLGALTYSQEYPHLKKKNWIIRIVWASHRYLGFSCIAWWDGRTSARSKSRKFILDRLPTVNWVSDGLVENAWRAKLHSLPYISVEVWSLLCCVKQVVG